MIEQPNSTPKIEQEITVGGVSESGESTKQEQGGGENDQGDDSEKHGNKYQWADVISNDDDVLDVHVIGDEMHIIYQLHPQLDLTWSGEYLNRFGYEHERSELVYNGVQKDVFVNQE